MIVPVLKTIRADRDLRRIGRWWAEHRPAAPDLFTEEVEELFAPLAIYPAMGRPYPHPEVPSPRRAPLRAT